VFTEPGIRVIQSFSIPPGGGSGQGVPSVPGTVFTGTVALSDVLWMMRLF